MRGEKDKNYWLKVFPCREVTHPRAGTSLWFGVEIEVKTGVWDGNGEVSRR